MSVTADVYTVPAAPEGYAVPAVVDSSPAGLLMLAVQRGADVDSLSKLMDLRDRWEAGEAKKAFYEAARKVQEECPRIKHNRTNTQTNSAYAEIEAINAALVPIYTRHGFSLTFSQGETTKPEHIRIVCDVSHAGGHTEQRWVDLPLDDSGIKGVTNKTGVHATGSTLSYGRRYLTLMIFNLSTGDDDDGQESGYSGIEKLMAHNDALRRWFDSVHCIKECISTQQWSVAAEAMAEIPDDDQRALWVAPTRGGIFTTAEREAMKGKEWGDAMREYKQHGEEAK